MTTTQTTTTKTGCRFSYTSDVTRFGVVLWDKGSEVVVRWDDGMVSTIWGVGVSLIKIIS